MAQVPAVAVVDGRSRTIFLSHCAIPRSERSSHVASSSMTWHFSESPGLSSICCRTLRAPPCTSSASTSAFLQASAQKRHRPHRCAPSRRAPGCSRCPRGPGSEVRHQQPAFGHHKVHHWFQVISPGLAPVQSPLARLLPAVNCSLPLLASLPD